MSDKQESAFYANCDPHDPDAVIHRAQRGADYYSWQWTYERYRLSQDGEPRDWEEYGALIAARTSTTPAYVAGMLLTFTVLAKLPKFQALVEELMHVPLHMLRAIAEQTFLIEPGQKDNEEVWQYLDEALTSYLTPRKMRQVLPTRKAIVQKVNRTLAELQLRTPPQKKDQFNRYEKMQLEPGHSEISFQVDDARAEVIDLAVRKYAEANDLTLAEACAQLLLDKVDVKVVLNTYVAQDVELAPMFLADGRILTETDWVTGLIDITRDLDLVARTEVKGYSASPAVRAYLAGRDGRCRYPGCTNKVEHADVDHRVNYEDGGPTHASNLVTLCRHHHNLKTDQSIRYWMDPFTHDIYWLFDDGTWVMDEASGPLAPRQKRWLRTLNDKWAAREKKIWTEDLDCAKNDTSDVTINPGEEIPF